MEITDEIKSKVFAQYLGNSIIINGEESNFVSINRSGRINKLEHNPDVCKLILKPLSEISDEDKESVYHISCEEDKYDYTQDFGSIKSCVEHWIKQEGIKTLYKTYNRYQFLQSKGYDLPQYLLGGKTLHESGLAIYEN